MNAKIDSRIVEFEKQLDAELRARSTVRVGDAGTLVLASNIIETAWADGNANLGERLTTGMHILAPYLIGRPRTANDPLRLIADLMTDLDFAAHYHVLRDMLYYTYNAPGTLAWSFEGDNIEIRFADRSLPRQLYISHNNYYLGSMEGFAEHSRTTQDIESLLTGTPEFVENSTLMEAAALIEREVDIKLALYFDLVADRSVSAGRYTFSQFYDVYRVLLVKALYHRYHAGANGSIGVISMALDELASNIALEVENVNQSTARHVIEDISYGISARRARLNPLYFPLLHLHDTDEIVLLPHEFCVWEGFVNFLRLLALRNPQIFQSSFSGQIGEGMVRRLASATDAAGFKTKVNVSLSVYDSALPDIDLLILSEEPTLGYVLLMCEVKAPLPPRWAKDQVRVLQPDSIAKAFDQISRIRTFLNSPKGIEFIQTIIPKNGLASFDEFAVLAHMLVITSDNAGAFFSDRDVTVVDYRTMERLLSRCDGDMAYILHVLSQFSKWADAGYESAMSNVSFAGRTIHYEGLKLRSLMDFSQVTWKSENQAQMMVNEMLRRGERPLDVWREQVTDDGAAGDVNG